MEKTEEKVHEIRLRLNNDEWNKLKAVSSREGLSNPSYAKRVLIIRLNQCKV